MNSISQYFTLRTALVLVSLTVILSSCSEDTQPLAPGEHFEAEGMLFLDGARKPHLKVFRGTVDTLLAKKFTAPLNNISDAFIVKFLDSKQGEINPPSETSKKLTWQIDDPSIVEVYQHEGEEGGYEFHLRGKKTGSTFIQFYVTHGDHSDYRSGKIPVEVQRDSTTIENPTILFIDEESETELATEDYKGKTTGQLQITAGDTTDHIEIEILNGDGSTPKLDASIFSVEITTSDNSIATIIPPTTDEPFAFHVIGKKSGTTNVKVVLKRTIEGKTIELNTFASVKIVVE